MKTSVVILVIFLVAGVAPAASQKVSGKQSCMETAMTQDEMNVCAYKGQSHADKELNRLYQAVLKKYGSKPALVKRLRNAQKAWVAFRDAEVKAQYPDLNGYESAAMCTALTMRGLTEQRIKQLRIWLNGIEEGDVCTGEVAIKESKLENGHKYK